MKLSLKLAILSTLNLSAVFAFNWYLLTELGPSLDSDAFYSAMTIPQLAQNVTNGTVMHALVPILAGEEKGDMRHNAWAFLLIIAVFFCLLSSALYVGAPYWVPLTVPGFSSHACDLTIELTRILLLGVSFSAVFSVQSAFYHARGEFAWVEIVSILANAIAFGLLIWFLPYFGVRVAAWLVTLRAALQTILLFPGIGLPLLPNFRANTVRDGFDRIKPLLFGSIYYKTDVLVDRVMLSMAESGSISLYNFGQQIYGAILQVLNKSIVSPLVRSMAVHFKSGDLSGFRGQYLRAEYITGVVAVIGFILFFAIGLPILRLALAHGDMSASSIGTLWNIMMHLGGAFVFSATGLISSSAFYASGDTITQTRIGIKSYTVYMPIKVLSFISFGIQGLALTASGYYLFNYALQSVIMHKRLRAT